MPSNRRSLVLFCLLSLGALALVTSLLLANPARASLDTAMPQQAPIEDPTCGPAFFAQTTQNAGTTYNTLTGVSAVAFDNAWAVGFYTNTSGVAQNLIEHWDGAHWSFAASPVITGDNYLQAVSARTGSDVWAVGYYRAGTGNIFQTLILHYDGSSWTRSTSPNPGTAENYLYGVAYVSANDAWAVGFSSNTTNVYRALTLHWDGTTWSNIPTPPPGFGITGLRGIAVIAANDIWAVGAQADFTLTIRTYAIHWNGTAWSAATPLPTSGCLLTAVAVASPGNLWAVGACQATTYQTLIVRYDGSSWTMVLSPDPGTGDNALGGIAVISPIEAYAVGGYSDGTNSHTLALYWDGASWSQVFSDNPGSTANQLLGASNIPSTTGALAVGSKASGGPNQTLAESKTVIICEPTATPTRTSSPTATMPAGNTSTATSTAANTPTAMATSATATATATNTPVQPTNTPVQPTSTVGTPRPTSTTCPIQFSDVPPGSTFYDNVRCLACRGIISGYNSGCVSGDPCFRPNNNVTRGQLAKIVSNAAGFSDPQTIQMFQDVPPGSTFFDYVGRLASRGYMGGYPCGGAGEPCVPPANLPYFRPNNNATRGQISKIVSNAAGFNDPPGSQMFQDVPPGSTFFDYVGRLASRGYMGGYPCGGAGEPCVPPANLPYFRPNNNATRGQSAKIVGNTFFPGCQTPGGGE